MRRMELVAICPLWVSSRNYGLNQATGSFWPEVDMQVSVAGKLSMATIG